MRLRLLALALALLPQPEAVAVQFTLEPTVDTFLSSPLFGSNVGNGMATCCGVPVPNGALISSHSFMEVDTDQGGAGPVEPLLYFDLIARDGSEALVNGSLLEAFAADPSATARLEITIDNGFGDLDVRRVTRDWLSDPIDGGNFVQRTTFPGAPSDRFESAFFPGVNVTNASTTDPAPAILADATGRNGFDVTADVRAWAEGADNFGWAFLPSDSNGGTLYSSEAADADLRPTLIVDVDIPAPIALRVNADTGETFLEGVNDTPSLLNSYTIDAPNGSLTPAGLRGLTAQDLSPIDADDDGVAGNDPGESWGVVNATANQIFEARLFGETAFDSSTRVGLGRVVDVAGGINAEIAYRFTTSSGLTFNATAEYFRTDDQPGDFNRDGVVDAADYTAWRDNVGAADEDALLGNGDGLAGVDAGDYQLWRDNFGAMAGSTPLAVPEPACLGAALASAFVAMQLKRRR